MVDINQMQQLAVNTVGNVLFYDFGNSQCFYVQDKAQALGSVQGGIYLVSPTYAFAFFGGCTAGNVNYNPFQMHIAGPQSGNRLQFGVNPSVPTLV
jgi:hypothetical protein